MKLGRRPIVAALAAKLAMLGLAPALARQSATASEGPSDMIEIEDPRYKQYFDARTALWSSIGDVDNDVISSIISPEFNGGPAWPTTRQAYRIVRTDKSLILASDGLSDLFVDTTLPDAGFECEVYVESEDLAGAAYDDLVRSWQLDLVMNLAQNVAYFGGINDNLDRLGVISFELPAPANMPERWVTQRGSVGALLNLTTPDRPEFCDLADDTRIRIISLTILLPDETEYVIEGRAKARADLAARLLASPYRLVSSSERPSMLA